MITLYQFARDWGIPNQSFFCAKIETYLRMSGVPYQVVEALPIQAPRGKLPFIEHNGAKIADSGLIMRYLQETYGATLDAHLTAQEQAIAKAYQRLLEEHLYWATMFSRWCHTESNWRTTKAAIFGDLPPGIRDLVAWGYRGLRIKPQIVGQGMGRHNPEEIFALAGEDIDALAVWLGDKPYFMGEKPTSLDASAFGALVNTLACPIESPLKEHALSKPNLVDYVRRMREEFFPELA